MTLPYCPAATSGQGSGTYQCPHCRAQLPWISAPTLGCGDPQCPDKQPPGNTVPGLENCTQGSQVPKGRICQGFQRNAVPPCDPYECPDEACRSHYEGLLDPICKYCQTEHRRRQQKLPTSELAPETERECRIYTRGIRDGLALMPERRDPSSPHGRCPDCRRAAPGQAEGEPVPPPFGYGEGTSHTPPLPPDGASASLPLPANPAEAIFGNGSCLMPGCYRDTLPGSDYCLDHKLYHAAPVSDGDGFPLCYCLVCEGRRRRSDPNTSTIRPNRTPAPVPTVEGMVGFSAGYNAGYSAGCEARKLESAGVPEHQMPRLLAERYAAGHKDGYQEGFGAGQHIASRPRDYTDDCPGACPYETCAAGCQGAPPDPASAMFDEIQIAGSSWQHVKCRYSPCAYVTSGRDLDEAIALMKHHQDDDHGVRDRADDRLDDAAVPGGMICGNSGCTDCNPQPHGFGEIMSESTRMPDPDDAPFVPAAPGPHEPDYQARFKAGWRAGRRQYAAQPTSLPDTYTRDRGDNCSERSRKDPHPHLYRYRDGRCTACGHPDPRHMPAPDAVRNPNCMCNDQANCRDPLCLRPPELPDNEQRQWQLGHLAGLHRAYRTLAELIDRQAMGDAGVPADRNNSAGAYRPVRQPA